MWRRIPDEVLHSWLHEGQHHLSFSSYVIGAAVGRATRALERVRHGGQGIAGSRDTFLPVMLDVAALEIATMALRPLSEGLALFAEHHLYLGPGDLSTSLTLLLLQLEFLRSESGSGRSPADTLRARVESANAGMRRARLSERAIEEATGLMFRPLDLSDGGYLPGYLWLLAARRRLIDCGVTAAADPETFLHVVREYFFSDYGMVDALTQPVASPLELADRVVDHLTARLASFPETTQADWEVAVVELLSKKDAFFQPFGSQAHLGVSSAVQARAEAALNSLDAALKGSDAMLLSFLLRQVFVGGSMAVGCSNMGADMVVSIGSIGTIKCRPLDTATPCVGAGSLTLYVLYGSGNHGALYAAIKVRGELQAVLNLATAGSVPEEVLNLIACHALVGATDSGLTTFVEGINKLLSEVPEYSNAIGSELAARVVAAHLNSPVLATFQLSGANLEQPFDHLPLDLLSGATLVGLCRSAGLAGAEIGARLRALNLPPLEEVDARASEHGLLRLITLE